MTSVPAAGDHPELGFEEKRAFALVAAKLHEFGLDVTEGVGGSPIVGTLKRGTGKRLVGLRADYRVIALAEREHETTSRRRPIRAFAAETKTARTGLP